MMGKKSAYRKITLLFAVLLIAAWLLSLTTDSFAGTSVPTGGTMESYCVVPPFIGGTAPPLVMLLLEKDHKLFFRAYDDYSDLDGDGLIDTTYKYGIDYYGYFDSYKCYRYSTSSGWFVPVGMTDEDKYCDTPDDTWSGNFLNWATMTRMDVMRKAFYGGMRYVDNVSTAPITVLERAFLPQDGHSFAKTYSQDDLDRLTPFRVHPKSNNAIRALTICNTTLDDYLTPPLMRVAAGDNNDFDPARPLPYGFENWASWNDWQCLYDEERFPGIIPVPDSHERPRKANDELGDFNVRVAACQPGLIGKERCKVYEQHGKPKPIGLVQEYGEDTSMYFGLITGSYSRNKSGGLLRQRLWDVGDSNSGDINRANGAFTGRGGLISVLGHKSSERNRIMIRNYDYDGGIYNWTDGNGTSTNSNGTKWCPWGLSWFADGNCTNWGNPLGEMYNEALRVFAGKKGATTDYTQDAQRDDNLKLESWNNTTVNDPYTYSAECAEAFVLMISDPYPSYDSDKTPGDNYWPSLTETDNLPVNVSNLLLKIGATEGFHGNSYFVGQSGLDNDRMCTAKTVVGLTAVRGLCPAEPGSEGSYVLSAMAYYGQITDLRPDDDPDTDIARTGNQNVTAYAVALGDAMPEISVDVGGSKIKIVPACYNAMTRTPCGLVTMRAEAITPTSGQLHIYWEDSMQGGDFDMDAYQYLYYQKTPLGNLNVSSYIFGNTTNQTMDIGFIASGTTADGPHLDVRINGGAGTCPLPVAFDATCYKQTTLVPGASTAGFLPNPLWLAAKYGGFRDLDGNGVPNLQSEWDTDENGVPDTYFDVKNPLMLEAKLREAFSSILNRVTSGTAASVLASGEGSGANLVQAIYYPRRRFFNSEVDWTGDLHAYWYYVDPFFENSSIREDTVQDHVLDLTDDDIVLMYFDEEALKTMARIIPDTDGDGVADDTGSRIVEFGGIDAIWKAGYYLWARDLVTDPRTIYVYNGVGLMDFTVANHGFLNPLMDVPDRSVPADGNTDETIDIIMYTMGEHVVADRDGDEALDYRSRVADIDLNGDGDVFDTVTMDIDYDGTTENVRESNVWKLGDIVSSTPTILGPKRLNHYYDRYKDGTYRSYYIKDAYVTRDTIFSGANDGMLHAFKLGELEYLNDYVRLLKLNKVYATPSEDGDSNRDVPPDTVQKFGAERWAFMPLHALPYLKYMAKTDYCHVNTVDLSPHVFDASIEYDNDLAADYPELDPTPTATGTCAPPATADCIKGDASWQSILIGGMRFGGACRPEGNTESEAVAAPHSLTYGTGQVDIGLSSYFALNVTDENTPEFMWQFPDPLLSPDAVNSLGFSMSGPLIVKINGEEEDETNTLKPSQRTNGHWFAVFASGPTGPINTTEHQFMGHSNQPLKIFILDLKTGRRLHTIETTITNAFAGSILRASLDIDGDYSDDVLYIGYTYKDLDTNPNYTWTKGGVIRVVTKGSYNPSEWEWSVLIDGIGPVTASVSKIYNTVQEQLWVYIGTGRYFYKLAAELDSAEDQQGLYGFLDRCYDGGAKAFLSPCGDANKTDPEQLLEVTNISDATYDDVMAAGHKGWKILLDTGGWDDRNQTGYGAERVITNMAISEDNVYFTTVQPFSGACKLGGTSYIWVVKYDTGGAPRSLKGKALIQVSTGAIEEVNLADSLSDKGGRRIEGRPGVPPPAQGLALLGAPPPLRSILHIRER